jgi:hypothetical protein
MFPAILMMFWRKHNDPLNIEIKNMKSIKTLKKLSLPGIIIVYIFILSSVTSCLKQTIPILNPNPNPTKTTSPGNPSGSPIIYTDVIPDTTISTRLGQYGISVRYYNVDLDKDGMYDFEFEVEAENSRGNAEGVQIGFVGVLLNTVASGDSNEVATDSGHVDFLDSLTIIDSSSVKWSSGNLSLGLSFRNQNLDTTYLGLKLIKGNAVYYGWVRVSNAFVNFTPDFQSTITIMDFAYNSISGKPILAGQTK